jgi:linoleate 10R-lipoxygenase
MTARGYADCQRDTAGPGNGSMLGRLLMRALPEEFSSNSTYAWFPLQTPEAMQEFLGKLGTAEMYDFVRPGDPMPKAVVKTYRDAETVLSSNQFLRPYGEKAARVISGDG